MEKAKLDRLVALVPRTAVADIPGLIRDAYRLGHEEGAAEARATIYEAAGQIADALATLKISAETRPIQQTEPEVASTPVQEYGAVVGYVRPYRNIIGTAGFTAQDALEYVSNQNADINIGQIRNALKTLRRQSEVILADRGVYRFAADVSDGDEDKRDQEAEPQHREAEPMAARSMF